MSHFLSFCQENKKIDAGICEIGNTEVEQLLKVKKKAFGMASFILQLSQCPY